MAESYMHMSNSDDLPSLRKYSGDVTRRHDAEMHADAVKMQFIFSTFKTVRKAFLLVIHDHSTLSQTRE